MKIRITHKGTSSYIDTSYYAMKSDVTSTRSDSGTKIRLKKVFIDTYLTASVTEYRKKINELGARVEFLTASDIKEIITKDNGQIDLFEFGDRYIKALLEEGRETTYARRKSSFKKFKEFTGRKVFSPELLTSKLLKDYERHLLKSGLKLVSLINNMADIQAVFNKAKYEYNDEELGVIRIHNSPFSRYSPPEAPPSKKRTLDIDSIKRIRDVKLTSVADQISRDLFMLSFYMCGTNANDFFAYLTDPTIVRFEYTRNKTKGKRADNAFISIKVVDEARPLVNSLAGPLQARYNTPRGLNNRLSESLKGIVSVLSEVPDLTFYHARHTFATLARKCGYSREDVGAALNHKRKLITDDYIDDDWTLIDKIQRSVLDLLK
ncbi:phage integrase SAM-like domain-containing protein [Sphingobacterium suaedae]|uniref:Phage integrase SAM-like domain-containing protein n=1 Tax=Sphingobacterium suaedae TaxID=1686402 RepID=A0ABW5KFE2_9SPHI